MTCLRFTETCSNPHWAAYLDMFRHCRCVNDAKAAPKGFLLKYAALNQVYTTRRMLLELARLSATTVPDHSIWSLFEMYLTSHQVCAHLPFQSPSMLNEDGASEREFWVSWCHLSFWVNGIYMFYFPFSLNVYLCLTNVNIWFPWIWCKIQLVNIWQFSLCFAEMSWLLW